MTIRRSVLALTSAFLLLVSACSNSGDEEESEPQSTTLERDGSSDPEPPDNEDEQKDEGIQDESQNSTEQEELQEQEEPVTFVAGNNLEDTIDGFGINILGYTWGGMSSQAIDVVTDSAVDIGAGYVIFNPAVMTGEDGLIDLNHQKTPYQQDVADLTKVAGNKNLPMVIKPILDMETLGFAGSSRLRSEFAPKNLEDWFDDYFYALDYFFEPAWQNGSNVLIIGTETTRLESVEFAAEWSTRIEALRQKYSDGERKIIIGYDQNWDRVGSIPGFTSSLDFLGVSAYTPTYGRNFDDHWQSMVGDIENYGIQAGIPIIIGEFGIAYTSSPESPWNPDLSGGRARNAQQVIDYVGSACRAGQDRIPMAVWAVYASHWIDEGLNRDSEYGFEITHDQTVMRELANQCGNN